VYRGVFLLAWLLIAAWGGVYVSSAYARTGEIADGAESSGDQIINFLSFGEKLISAPSSRKALAKKQGAKNVSRSISSTNSESASLDSDASDLNKAMGFNTTGLNQSGELLSADPKSSSATLPTSLIGNSPQLISTINSYARSAGVPESLPMPQGQNQFSLAQPEMLSPVTPELRIPSNPAPAAKINPAEGILNPSKGQSGAEGSDASSTLPDSSSSKSQSNNQNQLPVPRQSEMSPQEIAKNPAAFFQNLKPYNSSTLGKIVDVINGTDPATDSVKQNGDFYNGVMDVFDEVVLKNSQNTDTPFETPTRNYLNDYRRLRKDSSTTTSGPGLPPPTGTQQQQTDHSEQ
jgi:hypothetical protein